MSSTPGTHIKVQTDTITVEVRASDASVYADTIHSQRMALLEAVRRLVVECEGGPDDD